MVTAYIAILVLSAALIAFGAALLRARLARVLKRPLLPAGTIALSVTAAMFIVVAAPLWLFAALFLLALLLPRLPLAPTIVILIVTLPLMAAPLLGATTGLAIDAALIAACVLGESYAT